MTKINTLFALFFFIMLIISTVTIAGSFEDVPIVAATTDDTDSGPKHPGGGDVPSPDGG